MIRIITTLFLSTMALRTDADPAFKDTQIIRGERSLSGDDKQSRATCPVDYYVIDCGIEGRKIDGIELDERGTVCVAFNAAGGNGVIAIATCARVNEDLLVYETRKDHSAEDLICPRDYFATRCYVRTAWILTSAVKVTVEDDRCKINKVPNNRGFTFTAICAHYSLHSDKFVQVAEFPGKSEENYIKMLLEPTETQLSRFTVMVWKKQAAESGTFISYAWEGIAYGNGIQMEQQDGYMKIKLRNHRYFDVSGLALDEWHHIAFTADAGSLSLFVDGEMIGTSIVPETRLNYIEFPGYLVLGQDQDSYGGGFSHSDAFSGSLTHFQLIRTALDHAQISQSFQAGWRGTVWDDEIVGWGDVVGNYPPNGESYYHRIIGGEPGDEGLKGDTGHKGMPGEDGSGGENGHCDAIPGACQGEPGDVGPSGDAGEQGDQGEPGLDGSDGANGADGAPGERGVNGPRGETGIKGESGDIGEGGNNAKSNCDGSRRCQLGLGRCYGKSSSRPSVKCGVGFAATSIWKNSNFFGLRCCEIIRISVDDDSSSTEIIDEEADVRNERS